MWKISEIAKTFDLSLDKVRDIVKKYFPTFNGQGKTRYFNKVEVYILLLYYYLLEAGLTSKDMPSYNDDLRAAVKREVIFSVHTVKFVNVQVNMIGLRTLVDRRLS